MDASEDLGNKEKPSSKYLEVYLPNEFRKSYDNNDTISKQ